MCAHIPPLCAICPALTSRLLCDCVISDIVLLVVGTLNVNVNAALLNLNEIIYYVST